MFSMHRRWQVFRGEGTNPENLSFSVKKSKLLQLKTELDVIMAGHPNEDECDFKIKGSYFERSCTVYLGNSDTILAQVRTFELIPINFLVFCFIDGSTSIYCELQMRRKYTVKNVILGKDTFSVTVYPNVDFAFIVSLIVILDEINKDSAGED